MLHSTPNLKIRVPTSTFPSKSNNARKSLWSISTTELKRGACTCPMVGSYPLGIMLSNGALNFYVACMTRKRFRSYLDEYLEMFHLCARCLNISFFSFGIGPKTSTSMELELALVFQKTKHLNLSSTPQTPCGSLLINSAKKHEIYWVTRVALQLFDHLNN